MLVSFVFIQLPKLILISVYSRVKFLSFRFQTIYGEILPIQSNHDVAGLTRFLTERLLGNPDIAKAFAHPQVPGLFREGEANNVFS